MPTWTLKSEHVVRWVLVVPGFNQGRSKRGAWFAWTEKSLDFFKRFPKKGWNTVEYQVYEPKSGSPLSSGEIRHLAYEISSRDREYFRMLDFSEMFGGKLERMSGIRGLLLYIMAIVSTNQWWMAILLRPWMLLTNFINAARRKKVGRAVQRTLHLFVERGRNLYIREALTEAYRVYQSLTDSEPLKKYQYLRNYFKEKKELEGDPERVEAFELVEQAYRDIIGQLLGDSFLIKYAPTSMLQKMLRLIHITEQTIVPDNIFAVRNLGKILRVPFKISTPKIIGASRLDGNNLELFTLWTKEKDPIIVPTKGNFFLLYDFGKADSIQARNLPLEVILHVGTEKEREALLGIDSVEPDKVKPELIIKTQNRIQAALLDTLRQGETLLAYYFKESPKARAAMINNIPQYWWYKWVHIGFPWLWLTHGLPASCIVAGMWLFCDPLWEQRNALKFHDYFQNQLQGMEKQYRNVQLKVEVHSGLGDVNASIRQNKSYRDALEKIEEYHLPVPVRDMVLFDNITMETAQLNDFKREANNFTTLPIPALCYDVSEKQIKTLGEVLK